MDSPDAGDDTGSRSLGVVLIVRHEQAHLDESRRRVAQFGDPFTRSELPLLVLLRDPVGATTFTQTVFELADFVAQLTEPRCHRSPALAPAPSRSSNQPRM